MALSAQEELELSKKHEEILEKRASLLHQMQAMQEQQKMKKKQQGLMSQDAHQRNAQILQDLDDVGKTLHTRRVLHPDLIHLETRYWASVEQKLPEWEQFLLGKGQAPVSNTGTSLEHQGRGSDQQHPLPAHGRGKPPRPKTKSTI